MFSWFHIYMTFIASIRSVGTACTMAMVGVYLHKRQFIIGEGKRTLALISQQVTIPLFLFTKIVYCNQDWSDKPCPDITRHMADVWVLLLWPAYVVGWGLLVGWVAAKLSKTPPSQVRSVLAACAFGNSTGLPITLLTVVHANFPDTTELGRVDPTLFLSVYLLLYPVLQWGVGGWLLAPEQEEEEGEGESIEKGDEERGSVEETTKTPLRHHFRRSSSIRRNVLNNQEMLNHYTSSRRGISETDASLYISNADLVHMASQYDTIPRHHPLQGPAAPTPQSQDRGGTSQNNDDEEEDGYQIQDYTSTIVESPPGSPHQRRHVVVAAAAVPVSPTTDKNNNMTESSLLLGPNNSVNLSENSTHSTFEPEKRCSTLKKIVARCLQPPVVGAVAGLVVAATPLRGVLVDLDRRSAAPLEWLFDGLYAVGLAAVPINMIILGCNLSASQLAKPGSSSLLKPSTMAAIVIGKMVVMPLIGIATALLFNQYIWSIPESINASFYLVAMIVFITPTANNVMVMVELSGSGTREGIAQVIAWQYAVAPILLSITMTVVVGVASQWS